MSFKVTVLPSCEVLQCVHTLFRSPRYLFLLTLLVLTLARDFTPLASLNGAKSRGKKKEKKVGTAVRTTSETVLRSGSAGKILGELIGVRRLKIIIKKNECGLSILICRISKIIPFKWIKVMSFPCELEST